MTRSGQSIDGSIVGPPGRNTEAGWCSVFHQSTENLMIGRLTDADQRQDRDGARGAARIVDRLPQRDDAEIHEEQHEHRGQPRVPDPVGAPHRLAPQRAGDEADQRETGPDRGGGLLRDVGERMPPDERAERRGRHDAVEAEREPGRRHVQEHDADGFALLVVGRRQEPGHREPDGEEHRGGGRQERQRRAGPAQEDARVRELRQHGSDVAAARRRGNAAKRGPPLAPRERRARFANRRHSLVMPVPGLDPGIGPGIHDFAWQASPCGVSSRVRMQRRGWRGRARP